MDIVELFNTIREDEQFVKDEDKELEEIFEGLTDEQMIYLSKLRYKYFTLGANLEKSINEAHSTF